MPNHETNNVVIIGPVENIERFAQEAFVQPGAAYPGEDEAVNLRDIPILSFDLIVPQPANIEKGGCSGTHDPGEVCWYTWNLEHWGTKWGAYSHSHYQHRTLVARRTMEPYGRVDLRFETAWSQPTPIFEAIQDRWGVTVLAVTQDEGGYPDTSFGDGAEIVKYLNREVVFEFESWDQEVQGAN